jgi:hypothetical protein
MVYNLKRIANVVGTVQMIEPTHKGFADFAPSLKPLKMLANSVECSTEIGLFFHGFRLIDTILTTTV